MNTGYIYLIRTREFKNLMVNIFKVGKTVGRPTRRLGSYPRGSEIFLVLRVDNCHKLEKQILKKFTTCYTLRSDFGKEYFEGDPEMMISDIVNESVFLQE